MRFKGSAWLVVAVALWLTAVSAWATDIYVPDDYYYIYQAIAAADDGDVIYVAANTEERPVYLEPLLDYDGKDIAIKSLNGPNVTFIETTNIPGPVIIFESGETNDAVLDGFTIQNDDYSPAIRITGASPIISGCVIRNNTNPAGDGGGIKIHNSYLPQIQNNVFYGNYAGGSGAALHCYGSRVTIEGNTFYKNEAAAHGGAIFLRGKRYSDIHHNLIYDNMCQAIGGGICLSQDSNVYVWNNTIVYNTSTEGIYGTGLAFWYSRYCHAFNNIIAFNDCPTENYNRGFIMTPSTSPYINTEDYDDVYDHWLNWAPIISGFPGSNSFSEDPLFASGIFDLSYNSPCIDAGTGTDPDNTPTDLGYLYYDQSRRLSKPGLATVEPLPNQFHLSQNYPNPFNAENHDLLLTA